MSNDIISPTAVPRVFFNHELFSASELLITVLCMHAETGRVKRAEGAAGALD